MMDTGLIEVLYNIVTLIILKANVNLHNFIFHDGG